MNAATGFASFAVDLTALPTSSVKLPANKPEGAMKKCFWAVGVVLLLAGCATAGGYKKVLDTWIGSSELDLVRSWGVPAQTYEAGGRKFLIYSYGRNVYVPGVAPTYSTTVVGNTAYTTPVGGSPAMNINRQCSTTFELAHDQIVSYRFKGNDCKARAPK